MSGGKNFVVVVIVSCGWRWCCLGSSKEFQRGKKSRRVLDLEKWTTRAGDRERVKRDVDENGDRTHNFHDPPGKSHDTSWSLDDQQRFHLLSWGLLSWFQVRRWGSFSRIPIEVEPRHQTFFGRNQIHPMDYYDILTCDEDVRSAEGMMGREDLWEHNDVIIMTIMKK